MVSAGTPVAAYAAGGLFVWSGVYFMRYNDALLGTTFQLDWFLRLNAIIGCFAILIDVVRLLDLRSGYMPVIFAFGSGILWVACYYKQRIGESGPRE